MLRWWIVGVVLLATAARSVEPASDARPAEQPDPEIAWILENSYLGDGPRGQLRLTFEAVDVERVSVPLGLPGIDLDWGRRLLEGDLEIGVIPPESLVGLLEIRSDL